MRGEQMPLKQDESRLYWNPAPAKLDLVPKYVKQQLFPDYHGTISLDYTPQQQQQQLQVLAEESVMAGSDEAGSDDEVDPQQAIQRAKHINRR